MIVSSAVRAAGDILSPPFRAALWKVLGLTALVLVGLWFGFEALFTTALWPAAQAWLPTAPDWAQGAAAGAQTLGGLAAGLALALGLVFLIGPVSAVIAAFFLDDVAEVVERGYPQAPEGRAVPFWPGLVLSVKFFGVVVLGNLLALALLLVPGVNLVAFFVVNGYLVGREYFQFASMRFFPEAEAQALRERHRGRVFAAGLVVSALMAVPILNLLTPLFASALMVHLHQRIVAREGGFIRLTAPSRPVAIPHPPAA